MTSVPREVLYTNARIVDGPGEPEPGWMRVRGDRIEAIGGGAPATAGASELIDLDGRVLLPGFVDVHCHGGGGSSFISGDRAEITRAAHAHLRHGTTSLLASIGTSDAATMVRAARAVAACIDDGTTPNVAGIHFEGPFISPARPGAQNQRAIIAPSEAFFAELIDAAGGHATSLTIAPERPGAIDLIRAHHERLRFCIGHTDATAEQLEAAVDAGAHHVTHLFHAMPPLTHRRPGPVARALLDARVTTELIADGHHVADDTVRLAFRAAGADRVVLVTDAMMAAGVGEGVFRFTDREVDVRDGAAYLLGTDTLAGSVVFIADEVRMLRRRLGSGWWALARAASGNAARAMSLSCAGALEPGRRADAVVLDDDARLVGVIFGGDYATAPAEIVGERGGPLTGADVAE